MKGIEKIAIYQNPSKNKENDNKGKGGNVREKQEKKKKQTKRQSQKLRPEVRQNLGKYIQQFNGKRVKVNLLNGEILTGEMHTDFYNKYVSPRSKAWHSDN